MNHLTIWKLIHNNITYMFAVTVNGQKTNKKLKKKKEFQVDHFRYYTHAHMTFGTK